MDFSQMKLSLKGSMFQLFYRYWYFIQQGLRNCQTIYCYFKLKNKQFTKMWISRYHRFIFLSNFTNNLCAFHFPLFLWPKLWISTNTHDLWKKFYWDIMSRKCKSKDLFPSLHLFYTERTTRSGRDWQSI